MIDIHSHILPNIDDGPKEIEESLEILKKADLTGVSDIILTPHFMLGTEYNKKNQEKLEALQNLKEKAKEKNIKVNLYLGNEVFSEYNMVELLNQEKITTLNNSKYLLFELPRFEKFKGTYDEIFYLESKGITPILAHPERYQIIMENPNLALKLKERGVLFQSNIGSFLGGYGKTVQETSMLLLKHNLIDFIASDVHSSKHCHYEKQRELKEILRKFISEEEIEKLLVKNPKKVLENKKIEQKEPTPIKKNLFGKWK